ncbi:nucleotide exchange factor GrpE [Peptoniphilus sp.]|jgi:molecular chaperone GrpE|uniref:nucleotide exchange factor GrpE n=1 Tax=Peptoniphilus sp. TaxID=1971214 RepID=UPI003D93AFBC
MANEDNIKKDLNEENLENENIEENIENENIENQETESNKEYDDLKDKFMRLQADFTNFKRRTEEEKKGYIELGVRKIANDLLPVIDNFDRAIDSIEDKDSTYDGVKMIRDQLIDVLQKEGIVEMKALGEEFDPTYHHAVLTEDSDEYDSGVVIEVLQKGYLIDEKTLRPAMVKVSQ